MKNIISSSLNQLISYDLGAISLSKRSGFSVRCQLSLPGHAGIHQEQFRGDLEAALGRRGAPGTGAGGLG